MHTIGDVPVRGPYLFFGAVARSADGWRWKCAKACAQPIVAATCPIVRVELPVLNDWWAARLLRRGKTRPAGDRRGATRTQVDPYRQSGTRAALARGDRRTHDRRRDSRSDRPQRLSHRPQGGVPAQAQQAATARRQRQMRGPGLAAGSLAPAAPSQCATRRASAHRPRRNRPRSSSSVSGRLRTAFSHHPPPSAFLTGRHRRDASGAGRACTRASGSVGLDLGPETLVRRLQHVRCAVEEAELVWPGRAIPPAVAAWNAPDFAGAQQRATVTSDLPLPPPISNYSVSRIENGIWTPTPAKVASGRWTKPNSHISSLSRSFHCTIGSAPTRTQLLRV